MISIKRVSRLRDLNSISPKKRKGFGCRICLYQIRHRLIVMNGMKSTKKYMKNGHSTYIIYILGLCAALGLALACFLIFPVKQQDQPQRDRLPQSVLALSDEFWDVFISDLSETEFDSLGRRYDGLQENGLDYINYWTKANEAIQICYNVHHERMDREKLNDAEEIMRSLMQTFERSGKFPRPPYKDYEYGWVTSMDAPVIMLASRMLFELTERQEYADFYQRLKSYVFLTTEEDGFNFALPDGSMWPLEYARKDATEEKNYYVLNGSMLGYICLRALSLSDSDQELERYLSTVESAYKQRFDLFHMGNGWSFYMLHPKTIIPVHYMIFEEKLFRAAFYLNGIDEFQKEYLFRRDALRQSLRLEAFEKDDGIEFFLLRAACPNFYQIDCYGTRLTFFDAEGRTIYSEDFFGSGEMAGDPLLFYEKMFLTGTLPSDSRPAGYQVYSIDGSQAFLIYEEPFTISTDTDGEEEIVCELKAARDAVFSPAEGEITMTKELDDKAEGDVIFRLLQPREKDKSIYTFELDNKSEYTLTLGMIAYDDKNNGATRYYTPLLPGKNCIVICANSFPEIDDLENLSAFWLRIYDDIIAEDITVVPGEMHCFTSIAAYYSYIMSSPYRINPQ